MCPANVVRAPLPKPISAFIETSYLYGGESHTPALAPCVIYAITAYPDQFLTVCAEIAGTLFDDLPLHAFRKSTDGIPSTLETAVYKHSPGTDITVFTDPYILSLPECQIFDISRKPSPAEYVATVEWPLENFNMHICISNGGFYARPNYGISFRGVKELPGYKKQQQIWR
jgi:hypothetical protein